MNAGNSRPGGLDQELESLLAPSTVLVGIGNILRGDDAFGPSLIEEILTRRYDLKVLDAGTAPENHVPLIARLMPSSVLLIDAVHLGAEPGTIQILHPEELQPTSLTTHGLPLSSLMGEIAARTGVPVLLLGVQPARLSIGAPLSEPVREAVEEIMQIIARWSS